MKETSDMIEEDANKCIELKTRTGKQIVRLGDITYVNIVNRGLCYHMTNGTFIEGPMLHIPSQEAVLELAEEGFEMAGSYLTVNLKNIELADISQVKFVGEKTIFPSKNACAAIYEYLKI